MNHCQLCQKVEADKTGSHIVPHFLMKRIDNLFGSKERDKELGFKIGERHTTSYFGRSILPEKLKGIYGELNDEEFINSRSDLIVDYSTRWFCKRS